MIVVTETQLMDKIRICTNARAINPRLVVVATGSGPAERAWLQEVGAQYVCDPLEEAGDALMRAVHSGL
jgi:CPA2 family monovalent cation:H+ antiporter-2